jgi:hypothetical protein
MEAINQNIVVEAINAFNDTFLKLSVGLAYEAINGGF